MSYTIEKRIKQLSPPRFKLLKHTKTGWFSTKTECLGEFETESDAKIAMRCDAEDIVTTFEYTDDGRYIYDGW